MIYTEFVNRIASAFLGDQPNGVFDPTLVQNLGLVTALPQAIDYAEQRIYRELDLMSVTTRLSTSVTLIAANRNLTVPVGTFVGVNKINVITPAASLAADSGLRNPLTLISWDMMDAMYGSNANQGLPQYWSMLNASTFVFGPWPDQSYPVEIIGQFRPTPLSASNASTILSLYFPDLFFTAAMVFLSGFGRNYGAMSDDPAQGATWEQQYGKLMQSAQEEEMRKKMGKI